MNILNSGYAHMTFLCNAKIHFVFMKRFFCDVLQYNCLLESAAHNTVLLQKSGLVLGREEELQQMMKFATGSEDMKHLPKLQGEKVVLMIFQLL